MNSPGLYDLGSFAITTAVTGEVITSDTSATGATIAYIDSLEGMVGATLQANFTYGGGTTVTAAVTVETSFDQGSTWVEVANFGFTESSAAKLANLTNASVATVYTSAALSANTVKDGLLGERWRAKVTSTGTYTANTSVSVRLMAR